MPEADATWEPLDDLHAKFPTFQLEDELFIEGRVMLWWARFTSTATEAVAKRWTKSRARGHQLFSVARTWF